MKIAENFSLRHLNTFGMEVNARYFSEISKWEELEEIFSIDFFQSIPKMILGGGSNILFCEDFEGLVLNNRMLGITLLREDKGHVYLQVGAGENWHDFVMYCVNHGYGGVENLSLIPGKVGASPIQNIGAYGVELKDVFVELEAMNILNQEKLVFSSKECEFGYRESIFKRKWKDKLMILSVTFRLDKDPVFHTSYGVIEKELETMGVQEPSLESISQAIIRIRRAKLPDPNLLGNAGSFFKNPEISSQEFHRLQVHFPQIISFPLPDGKVKLAAGWLIEQCGWKGFRAADAGVHLHQALILVNYGKATGKEIYQLSVQIAESVKAQFGINLQREVNILGKKGWEI
ncbi:MAG: UDP-N-acetylmuramate dehydrogenase [Chitinophagaceae bacterium]